MEILLYVWAYVVGYTFMQNARVKYPDPAINAANAATGRQT